MSDYLPVNCHGCGKTITPAVATYYCNDCIATQAAAEGDLLAAFDAYHAYADECAKGNR